MMGNAALRAFALLGVLMAAGGAFGQTAPLELKLGTFTGPQHPVTKILNETAAVVEKLTDGRVKVRVFDSGTLGNGPGTLDAVQKGEMDIGNYILTYASLKQLPFLGVGDLPYVYKDGAGYIDAWTKDNFLLTRSNKQLADRGYDNVFIAAPYFSGFARMGFRSAEPKEPVDLKGLKIRGTGTYNAIVESYGAVVVTIGTPEVYGALEHGLIDGAIGLGTNWTNWRWMEQAKYLLDVPIAPVGGVLAINKTSWSKISEADRKKLQAYFDAVQNSLNKYYSALDRSENKTISAHMKIYTPTDAERAKWQAPKEKIVAKWLALVGPQDGKHALDVIGRFNQR